MGRCSRYDRRSSRRTPPRAPRRYSAVKIVLELPFPLPALWLRKDEVPWLEGEISLTADYYTVRSHHVKFAPFDGGGAIRMRRVSRVLRLAISKTRPAHH